MDQWKYTNKLHLNNDIKQAEVLRLHKNCRKNCNIMTHENVFRNIKKSSRIQDYPFGLRNEYLTAKHLPFF